MTQMTGTRVQEQQMISVCWRLPQAYIATAIVRHTVVNKSCDALLLHEVSIPTVAGAYRRHQRLRLARC